MQCAQCGNTLKETAKICIRCGSAVSKGGTQTSPEQSATVNNQEKSEQPLSLETVETTPIVELTPPPINERFAEQPILDQSDPNTSREQQPSIHNEAPVNLDSQVQTTVLSDSNDSPSETCSEPTTSTSVKPLVSTTTQKNKLPLIAGGVAVVAIGLVVFYNFTKTETTDKSNLSANNIVAKSTESPSSQSASENNLPTKTPMSKEILNQILSGAGKGDWDSVDILVRQSQALQLNTSDRLKARQLNQKGVDALKQSSLNEAVNYFKNGIAEDPNDAEIKNNLSFTYIKMKQYDLARGAIIDSLLVSPTRGTAWLNASEIFAELNNPQAASQALKVALHFANNKQKAIETLSDDSKIPSEKLRTVIKSTLPHAAQIPSFKRN